MTGLLVSMRATSPVGSPRLEGSGRPRRGRRARGELRCGLGTTETAAVSETTVVANGAAMSVVLDEGGDDGEGEHEEGVWMVVVSVLKGVGVEQRETTALRGSGGSGVDGGVAVREERRQEDVKRTRKDETKHQMEGRVSDLLTSVEFDGGRFGLLRDPNSDGGR